MEPKNSWWYFWPFRPQRLQMRGLEPGSSNRHQKILRGREFSVPKISLGESFLSASCQDVDTYYKLPSYCDMHEPSRAKQADIGIAA